MERRVSRLTGPRVLAAEGALFVAGFVAACSPSVATETQKPTSLPTETPVPTITAVSSELPLVTPSPSVELTPSPTPEATSKPITSIIEGAHPKIAVAKITSDIKAYLANNPQVLDTAGWTKEGYLRTWNYCQKGDPTVGGDPYTNKESSCQDMIGKLWTNYQNLHDENSYKLAREVYGYAANTLPKDYLNGLKSSLEQIF